MASVSVGGGAGKRRSLDSEINMIPMIDLLMVTISFLLITAVWVHAHRLEADANVPGASSEPPCANCAEDARLHVSTADPTKFVLAWKQGSTVIKSVDVPRDPMRKGMTFPQLATRVGEEWRSTGHHRDPSDRHFDSAVVHSPNDMPYAELVAVMDAVSAPKRRVAVGASTREAAAFAVTFAME